VGRHIDVTGTLWNYPKVTAEVRLAMERTQQKVQSKLEELTPVRTGRMKASWQVAVGDRTLRIQNFASSRGTMYAGFIDNGTRRIKPRFITKTALEEAVSVFTDELGALLSEKFGGTRNKTTREFATAIAKLQKKGTAIGVTTNQAKPKN